MAANIPGEAPIDMSGLDIDHVVDMIGTRANDRPAFIHVSGASASGKSTLARGLAQILPDAQVFDMDSYLSEKLWDQARVFNHDSPDPARPYIAGISPEIWDMPLLEAHLAALSQGQSVAMPIFDETIKDRVGYRPFEPSSFIIVEGNHAFSEPFYSHCDYGILVTASLHDRLARKMVRTHAVYGLDDIDEVTGRYLAKDEPVRRVYAAEHEAMANQVVCNEANPQRDYAYLLPATSTVAGSRQALSPLGETGMLHDGEELHLIRNGDQLGVSYSIDERTLVCHAIRVQTASLLMNHYEVRT